MQRSEFSTGGFVLHKININGNHYSAWFDADGRLTDAELVLPTLTRSVPSAWTHIRARLDEIGRREAATIRKAIT